MQRKKPNILKSLQQCGQHDCGNGPYSLKLLLDPSHTLGVGNMSETSLIYRSVIACFTSKGANIVLPKLSFLTLTKHHYLRERISVCKSLHSSKLLNSWKFFESSANKRQAVVTNTIADITH